MRISDFMKRNVVAITPEETIGRAAELFVSRHIGTLPVIDEKRRLVGVLQLHDLVELVMPDFVRLMKDYDFVHDFGAVELRQPSREVLDRPVRGVMQPPYSTDEACGVMCAISLLRQHDLHDLPVVDADGRLVGIVSRVDVGVALLSSWQVKPEGKTS